jgi:hypothetical protein
VFPSEKKETLQGIQDLIEWNRNYIERSLPLFIKQCENKDKLVVLEDNKDDLKFI